MGTERISTIDPRHLTKAQKHSRHHLRLLDEIILGHCAALHHLHGRVNRAAPFAAPHHTELARTELLQQHQLGRMDLPFVVRQAGRGRHGPIAWRRFQAAGETAGVVAMVVDQIGNGFAAVLLGQVVLGAVVLLDVVVLDVRLRAADDWKRI